MQGEHINITDPFADFWCLYVLLFSYLGKAGLHTKKNAFSKASVFFFSLTDLHYVLSFYDLQCLWNIYEKYKRKKGWQQLFLNLILQIAKVIYAILWVSQSFTKMSISVERRWKKNWIPFETGLMLT